MVINCIVSQKVVAVRDMFSLQSEYICFNLLHKTKECNNSKTSCVGKLTQRNWLQLMFKLQRMRIAIQRMKMQPYIANVL